MTESGPLFGKAFELSVGGQTIQGFDGVRVTRSLEAAAAGFEMEVSDTPSSSWPIGIGDACELRVDGEVLVAGFIDTLAPSFSDTSHEVKISGREKTADLVDCGMPDQPHEFYNLTLDAVAARLAQPFGVPVVLEVDPGPEFFRFALQPGETVYEAIERGARIRGLLVTSDGLGKLLLTTPGNARAQTALEYGKNVKSGSALFDVSQRFRRYVIRGQESGSDEEFGDEISVEGEAFDDAVRKERELVVLADGQVWIATAQRRAQWEAAVRAARGSKVTLLVQGWRQGPGLPFWKPNLVVHATVAPLRLDRELLISEVRFSRDKEGGTTTELVLMRADAFQPKPELLSENDLGLGGDDSDEQD